MPAGLFVGIWSRKVLGTEWSPDVESKQGHKRVERGPRRFMRHPIYTNHLLMGLATAIASGLLVAYAKLASFVREFWIRLKQEQVSDEYHTRRASHPDNFCIATADYNSGTVYWENRDAER
jgi:protein-S-isoprenylcysteine O-methyltransferase Ste14